MGIARGGLVPARILADLLRIDELAILTVEYYSGIGQAMKEPILKQGLQTPVFDKRILLVDDISDSGKTLQLAKENIMEHGPKEIRIATVYCKPGTVTKPDYFEKETRHWVVFPWETKETLEKN